MSINIGFAKKDTYIELVKNVYELDFKYNGEVVERTLKEFDKVTINKFGVFIEYPYVDKYYRDTYYNYLSTKHQDYLRNSIRISFFKNEINNENFRKKEYIENLQKEFLGFLTLRPSSDHLISRSVISPKLLKYYEFKCCQATFNVEINGVKFEIKGFPFCSQDGEVLSCAETTILTLLEYYGTKYPEYKPVLPSNIISKLSQRAYERQLPTSGLNTEDISFVLKEYGFGTKVYYKKHYSKTFRQIFNIYVDSGIPFIATLENDKIGHAILIIGRENHFNDSFDNKIRGLLFPPVDFSEGINKYVVMDDNRIPYRLVPFENPTFDYGDKNFKGCNIESIVVPLYSKVYVDAEIAIKRFSFILNQKQFIEANNCYLIKIFLATSRSFKGDICLNEHLDKDVKEVIINKHMPKFIWISELYNKGDFQKNKPSGLIIVDATEPNVEKNNILFVAYDNYYVTWNAEVKTFKKSIVDLTNLHTFDHNLQ